MMWITRPRSKIAGLAAIKAGTGQKVLLLHGVGLRSEAWNAQIDVLANEYQVYALDMAGHGESSLSRQSMTLADYSNATMAAVAEIGGPLVIVGHSMGAMIAADLAVRFPEHVAAIVTLNAVFERTGPAKEAVAKRAASLDADRVYDPASTLERWFGSEHSAECGACRDWLTSVNPAAYKMAYTAFATSKVPGREMLGSLLCPALFMTGSIDPNSTTSMSINMAKLASKGRAIIVDGAAHMMPMTHPSEVNEHLLAFLRKVR